MLPLALPVLARAQSAKAVMEGVRTTNNTILVSTRNVRVLVATHTYSGNVPNTGLYTSSNVVVSNTGADKCVIYATGSITCIGYISAGVSGIVFASGTWTVDSADTGGYKCYGTTLTWTSKGNLAEVGLSVEVYNNAVTAIALYLLIDGVPSALPVVYIQSDTANLRRLAGFGPIFIKPGAGTHSICLAPNSGAGISNFGDQTGGKWYVREF